VILHRDGAGRQTGAEVKPASVPDLSRVLRQARTARGLELSAVSQQIGIPLDQLQDLESGTVDRLPDRVAILKALSRYAAFLNLPGDQFVMTLVEHWPNAHSGAPPVVVVHDGPANGNRSTDTAVGALAASAPVVDDLSTRAVPLSVSTSTAPPTSIGLPILEGRHNSTAQVPMVMADTGVTPAVRGAPVEGLGIVVVRSLVIVATLLLAVGTAWLVVNRLHPEWLADLHIPYTSKGATGVPSSTANPATTATSTAPSQPNHPVVPTMQLTSASATGANFTVSSVSFEVRLSALHAAAWVSISGPTSVKPEFVGTLQSGQSHVVVANHQVTIIVGSTAARLAVQVNKHVIGTYVPPGAPFTITLTTK
jgi:cytoskeletal protein RodZ